MKAGGQEFQQRTDWLVAQAFEVEILSTSLKQPVPSASRSHVVKGTLRLALKLSPYRFGIVGLFRDTFLQHKPVVNNWNHSVDRCTEHIVNGRGLVDVSHPRNQQAPPSRELCRMLGVSASTHSSYFFVEAGFRDRNAVSPFHF